MKFKYYNFVLFVMIFALVFASNKTIKAQQNPSPEILNEAALSKIVPTGFYFAGQSAQTQMRNSAAAKLGENRFIIAGLVDTSGYSTEISGIYEGFFITDSPVNIGDKQLNTGAYGFGFSKDGKVNIFDVSSKQILSVKTVIDAELKRPRPLMMLIDGKGVRLYKGKNYILFQAR